MAVRYDMKRRRGYHKLLDSTANNRGVTMVETLVAFTVLMIILGILYGTVAFCTNLRMRAHDTDMAVQGFERELYNTNNKAGRNTNLAVTPYITQENEPLFYLSISDETSADNFGRAGESYYKRVKMEIDSNLEGDAKVEAENKAKSDKEALDLSLVNIDAITYVYIPDEGMDSEKIIIPKAIQFIHKEDQNDGE